MLRCISLQGRVLTLRLQIRACFLQMVHPKSSGTPSSGQWALGTKRRGPKLFGLPSKDRALCARGCWIVVPGPVQLLHALLEVSTSGTITTEGKQHTANKRRQRASGTPWNFVPPLPPLEPPRLHRRHACVQPFFFCITSHAGDYLRSRRDRAHARNKADVAVETEHMHATKLQTKWSRFACIRFFLCRVENGAGDQYTMCFLFFFS